MSIKGRVLLSLAVGVGLFLTLYLGWGERFWLEALFGAMGAAALTYSGMGTFDRLRDLYRKPPSAP